MIASISIEILREVLFLVRALVVLSPQGLQGSTFGFRIDPSIVGQLLRALPQSCINIELDTNGHDWAPGLNPHHLCPDIRSLLPRLRHLKLRLHWVCCGLIVADPDNPETRSPLSPSVAKGLGFIEAKDLETFTISEIRRRKSPEIFGRPPMMQCDILGKRLDAGVTEPILEADLPLTPSPHPLAPFLTNAHKMGSFPNAQAIEVIQLFKKDPKRSSKGSTRPELYRVIILLRGCIRNVTLSIPWRMVGEGMLGLYDRTGTCYIGSREATLEKAEGSVWGRATAYGARFPRQVARHVWFQLLPLFSRKEWRSRSDIVMVSWKESEEDEGQGNDLQRIVELPGADAAFDIRKMPVLNGTAVSGECMDTYFGGGP